MKNGLDKIVTDEFAALKKERSIIKDRLSQELAETRAKVDEDIKTNQPLLLAALHSESARALGSKYEYASIKFQSSV